MIITVPNSFVGEVHDRMPVLLAELDFEPWLSGAAGVEMVSPAQRHVAALAGIEAAAPRPFHILSLCESASAKRVHPFSFCCVT